MDAGLLATMVESDADADADANVIWTGDAPAPTAVECGGQRIELPDDDVQREGFFCEAAHVLLSLQWGWKRFIGRGE